MLTWIPSLAVGTCIVPGYILNEILEGLLVARLLALAHGAAHAHCSWPRKSRQRVAERGLRPWEPLLAVGITSNTGRFEFRGFGLGCFRSSCRAERDDGGGRGPMAGRVAVCTSIQSKVGHQGRSMGIITVRPDIKNKGGDRRNRRLGTKDDLIHKIAKEEEKCR